MSFGIREWMLLLGSLLFIAVVVDGLRRVLADRREEVRLSKHARKGFPSLDEGEPKTTELTSTARVVPRAGNTAVKSVEAESVDKQRKFSGDSANYDADDTAHNEAVPVLLDPLPEDEFEALVARSEVRQETLSKPSPLAEPRLQESLPLDEPDTSAEPQPDEMPQTLSQTVLNTTDESRDKTPIAAVEEVILINVHAPKGQVFNGEVMLELLLEQDIRFGSMDIFHKRESRVGNSQILFSVANSVEPGIFDLNRIETFETPCITLFLQLPGPSHPMAAFKQMLASADSLAKALGGFLLDERRNPISQQTLEHLKQRVEDFERRSLLKHRK